MVGSSARQFVSVILLTVAADLRGGVWSPDVRSNLLPGLFQRIGQESKTSYWYNGLTWTQLEIGLFVSSRLLKLLQRTNSISRRTYQTRRGKTKIRKKLGLYLKGNGPGMRCPKEKENAQQGMQKLSHFLLWNMLKDSRLLSYGISWKVISRDGGK